MIWRRALRGFFSSCRSTFGIDDLMSKSLITKFTPGLGFFPHSCISPGDYHPSCLEGSSYAPKVNGTIIRNTELRKVVKTVLPSVVNDTLSSERVDDGGSTVEILAVGPDFLDNVIKMMEISVDNLWQELVKLRGGGASTGMLDHIMVQTNVDNMVLYRLALVSVIDSDTLCVTPYEPHALKLLERAITSSPLGLNPKADGNQLIVPIPPLTEEDKQALCKVVTKLFEDVEQEIRRAREVALNCLRKLGLRLYVAKEVENKVKKDLDEWTKKAMKLAEDMCKGKEREITSS